MPTDRLSATFSALADPTRRAILARLALGETTVSELAKPFKMSGPAVSKHLKVLEHAGLIARGRPDHHCSGGRGRVGDNGILVKTCCGNEKSYEVCAHLLRPSR